MLEPLSIEDQKMKQLRYLEPHLCALCPATILLAAPKNYWPGAPSEQAQYRAGSICAHCVRTINSETRRALVLTSKAKSESFNLELELKKQKRYKEQKSPV